MEPAAIRYKNPGAMWPGKIATKWGSTRFVALNDGTGQGNKIAVFDTWVQGICAQLDLWRTSPNYKNKKFKDAIAIWSGHNNVPSYIAYCKNRVPGLGENTVMNDDFWFGPMGIPFLKAQSGHEAGKPIPAAEADWLEAQKRVMTGAKTVAKITTAAKVAVPTVTTVAVAASQGWSWLEIGLTAFVTAGVVTAVILLIKKARS